MTEEKKNKRKRDTDVFGVNEPWSKEDEELLINNREIVEWEELEKCYLIKTAIR